MSPPTLDAEVTAGLSGRPDAPSRAAADDLTKPTGLERRLLIVDDDESVRRIVAALLKDEGYDTHTAGSAEEALAALERDPCALVIT
ncbi:hypothetical protein L6R52_44280, partial [Myxococcota bacterium]|nr:hypothetical protein [Myxococcota bacterium]